jgi:hypothetical protein
MLKVLEIIFFPSIEAYEENNWGIKFQNREQLKTFQGFSWGSSGQLKSLTWMTSRSHLSNAWLQHGHSRLRQAQCAYVGEGIVQLEPAVLSPTKGYQAQWQGQYSSEMRHQVASPESPRCLEVGEWAQPLGCSEQELSHRQPRRPLLKHGK